ncbi:Acetyltransferase (GNAT) domain-containing protein, partial [Candidatus Electrothrix marina]
MSTLYLPQIQKARRVTGKTLAFRDATVTDAEFILMLRTNEKRSRYLSPVSNDIESQQAWLTRYAQMQDQAYFIIEFEGEFIGTVRCYDAREDSFCWGSWILIDNSPRHAAIESALMVYAYALN